MTTAIPKPKPSAPRPDVAIIGGHLHVDDRLTLDQAIELLEAAVVGAKRRARDQIHEDRRAATKAQLEEEANIERAARREEKLALTKQELDA